jgi:DNA-binding NarL/FixJ family response regulator
MALRLPRDMKVLSQERGFVKKNEGIEIVSEAGVGNGATRSPKDALRGILTRHSPALSRMSFRNSCAKDVKVVRQDFILSKPYSHKNSQRDYANLYQRASSYDEVLPQTLSTGARFELEAWKLYATRGRKAKMALALQVVSSHVLGVLDIESTLSIQDELAERLLPHAASEADALKRSSFPRLFLLDGCSLTLPLGPLCSRLRADSPGSKFLVLLAPERSGEAEMIHLFHWGIDGMLVLDKKWKTELPRAVRALLCNRLWVPSAILLAFVKQMKALLDRQLLPEQSLTAREGQVLQLLFRRLTNKEIACELKVSERTAKFHASNVLNKFGLENRRNLLEAFGLGDLLRLDFRKP